MPSSSSLSASCSSFMSRFLARVQRTMYPNIPGPPIPDGEERTKKLRDSLRTDKTRIGRMDSTSRKLVVRPDLATAEFFAMDDVRVVHLIADAFDIELDMLKNTNPAVEASPSVTTKGGFGDDLKTPSRLIYGEDFPEVNRTILSMLALKWIISDDYRAFASRQIPVIRITRESFTNLRDLFLADIQSPGEVYALFVSTIVNDVGKDPNLYDRIINSLPEGMAHPNHDRVVLMAAEQNMLEIMKEFPESHPNRKTLLLGLTLGASLNIAQLAQGENVPASLSGLSELRGHPHAFALKYLEIILDVAGAQGHADARGVLSFIEPVYQSFATVRTALLGLIERDMSLRQTYDIVLIQRADMLRESGFEYSLDVSDPADRGLLRLLCMGRANNTDQANLFHAAYTTLSPSIATDLINGLSVDGVDDGLAILPYYAPSLFAVTLKAYSKADDPSKVAALQAIMRFLAKVYMGTKPEPGKPGKVVECDVSFAQEVLKHDDFPMDPTMLDRLDIPANSYGEPV